MNLLLKYMDSFLLIEYSLVVQAGPDKYLLTTKEKMFLVEGSVRLLNTRLQCIFL